MKDTKKIVWNLCIIFYWWASVLKQVKVFFATPVVILLMYPSCDETRGNNVTDLTTGSGAAGWLDCGHLPFDPVDLTGVSITNQYLSERMFCSRVCNLYSHRSCFSLWSTQWAAFAGADRICCQDAMRCDLGLNCSHGFMTATLGVWTWKHGWGTDVQPIP